MIFNKIITEEKKSLYLACPVPEINLKMFESDQRICTWSTDQSSVSIKVISLHGDLPIENG